MFQLPLDVVEEALDDRLAVREPMLLLGVPVEPQLPDLLLDGIETLHQREHVGDGLGLGGLGVEERAARMRPAQRVGNAGLLGIALVGGIAVGEQHGAVLRGQAEDTAHMRAGA